MTARVQTVAVTFSSGTSWQPSSVTPHVPSASQSQALSGAPDILADKQVLLFPGLDAGVSTSESDMHRSQRQLYSYGKSRRSPGTYVSEEALQYLRDGKRLTASVVNAALRLREYFGACPDTSLVHSSQLAK